MSDPILANASPEKRLFISLLTRDISITAAFLDLIDNSVNATIEPIADRLASADAYVSLLDATDIPPPDDIRVQLSPDRIEVKDTAPGISLTAARHHVFRFGRPEADRSQSDRLSVYGLGLKRAFFKLGRHVKIISDHCDGGFSLDLSVDDWARKTELPWQFPVTSRSPAVRAACGTSIEIDDLYPEVRKRLSEDSFPNQLRNSVGNTYAYFLATLVRIFVNDEEVAPTVLQVGENRATDRFELNDVTCTVTAGLGNPEGRHYRDRGSGWFVFCNGRSVINADKTPLTGWNNNGLPIFQPKHRPFLGTAFFVSRQSDKLPWDTTKSRIDQDSAVWQQGVRCMVSVGRSVITFLGNRYSDEGSDAVDNDLTQLGKQRLDAMRAASGQKRVFSVPRTPPQKPTMRVQYDAKKSDVRRIAEYLDDRGMSGSDVGRYTFDFFLRNEVEDE